jgi:ABC-2 type transport system ATP-binding protein
LEPLLKVDDVRKSFGPVQAVHGVSLEARPGRVLALLGPNGAGKTTVLRMIIGMIRPDHGEITYRFGGVPTHRPDPQLLGYLPEERGLYLDVPVRRMLLYFGALRGLPRQRARMEADRWLERFDLLDRAEDEVRDLSKGNQQKIQFISAILHAPPLAILDEPFSGLDPLNQSLFLELIRELADGGTAVILSAHQMELVERLADRVLLIRGGEVRAEGTIPELRERWGAGRRLRLRVEGRPEIEFLRGMDAVRDVRMQGLRGEAGAPVGGTADVPAHAHAHTHGDAPEESEVHVLLEPRAPVSELLERAGRELRILDIHSESVTLHDVYVESVGQDATVGGAS